MVTRLMDCFPFILSICTRIILSPLMVYLLCLQDCNKWRLWSRDTSSFRNVFHAACGCFHLVVSLSSVVLLPRDVCYSQRFVSLLWLLASILLYEHSDWK